MKAFGDGSRPWAFSIDANVLSFILQARARSESPSLKD